jgi:hypothetical protein
MLNDFLDFGLRDLTPALGFHSDPGCNTEAWLKYTDFGVNGFS